MNVRTVLVIALALVCGVSAIAVVQQLRQDSLGSPDGTVPVLTAKVDVMRGSILDPSLVEVSNAYSKYSKPEGALSSVEDLAGRAVLAPLSKGLPIVESQLTSKNDGRGLAAMIPEGMRAFTIQTTHVAAGVGGFVQPGDKVDVLLTTTPAGQGDSTGGGVTTTLLQNVQVLAVAQRLDSPEDSKGDKARKGKDAKTESYEAKSVTLLVSPNQAAKLDLGMNKGILHLALRNPKDDREAHTLPATMAELQFHQDQTVASPIAEEATSEATQESATAPKRPSFAHIRTLRGVSGGTILVELQR